MPNTLGKNLSQNDSANQKPGSWHEYIESDLTDGHAYLRSILMPLKELLCECGGKDSSKPDGLAAEVKVLSVRRDWDRLVVTARVRNTGSAFWLSRGRGTVFMAVRPFDKPDCLGATRWEWREPIPTNMLPNQETELTAHIDANWFTKPFSYVCVEMMSEPVAWFRQFGSRPDVVPVSPRMERQIVETIETQRAADEQMRKFTGKNSPVLYLDFENSSDDRFLDISGNNFNATIWGQVVLVPGGLKGQAAKFDGESWLEIDEPGVFNAPDITVSLWAKPETIRGRRGLTSKRVANSIAPWVVYQNGASLSFEATQDNGASGSAWLHVDSAAILKERTWTHVGAVIKESEGVTLFIDGEPVAQKRSTGRRTIQYQPLIIGKEIWGGNPPKVDTPGFYIGLLDEVKVWTRALSADEIKAEFERIKQ